MAVAAAATKDAVGRVMSFLKVWSLHLTLELLFRTGFESVNLSSILKLLGCRMPSKKNVTKMLSLCEIMPVLD